MKKLSLERMERIEGGDCFAEADLFFTASDFYLEHPSDASYAAFVVAQGILILCVANIP